MPKDELERILESVARELLRMDTGVDEVLKRRLLPLLRAGEDAAVGTSDWPAYWDALKAAGKDVMPADDFL